VTLFRIERYIYKKPSSAYDRGNLKSSLLTFEVARGPAKNIEETSLKVGIRPCRPRKAGQLIGKPTDTAPSSAAVESDKAG